MVLEAGVAQATASTETQRSRRSRARGGGTPLDYLLIILGQFAVIWPIAMRQAFDTDEFFFAMQIKEVAHGKTPYFDFWYQQTPLLPYVYGAWSRLVGENFQSLRALSALMTIALGVAVFWHVGRRQGRLSAYIATAVYISTGLVFWWYGTYKTYILSTLLLFLAFVLVAAVDRDVRVSAVRWFLSGMAIGLAIDTRLYFVAVVPVFMFYATRPWRRQHPLGQNLPLLGGLTIGLLPCIVFFMRDPQRFIDDVWGSQATRSNISLPDALLQKWRTAEVLLTSGQFLVLVAAAALVGTLVVLRRRRPPLALTIAAVLAVVSFLPTPTYDQYFVATIPFLIVGAFEAWSTVRTELPRAGPPLRRLIGAVLVTGLVAYVLAGAQTYDQRLNSGDSALDVRKVRTVSEELDKVARPGEPVIAFNPVFLYESHAAPFSGLESDFATQTVANLHLSDRRAAAYKMVPLDRLVDIVRARRVRLVLASAREVLYPRPWPQILRQAGYRPVWRSGFLTLYERRGPGA